MPSEICSVAIYKAYKRKEFGQRVNNESWYNKLYMHILHRRLENASKQDGLADKRKYHN